MINFNEVTQENLKDHHLNWPQISDHPYRILIIGGSRYGKTNSLFNLIIHQTDINKIYLYAKDPYKAKYQQLINKRESTGLKHFNDSEALTEYSNDIDDIYKNIEEWKQKNKKRKILIVFDDMITDMLSNKNPNLVVIEIESLIFLLFLLHNLILLY